MISIYLLPIFYVCYFADTVVFEATVAWTSYPAGITAFYNTPRFSDRHNYGGMTRNRYICKKEENQNGKTI